MEKINKKGFTLVELLAVIVVLAIVMSLAVVSITNVVDDTRKKGFVTDAKSFLDGAHQLVVQDSDSGLYGGTGHGYAPECKPSSSPTYIQLAAINVERGGINSPYNNKYLKGTSTSGSTTKPGTGISYVEVTATVDATANCKYSYKIYLTDGTYAIGTNAAPAAELTEVTPDSVKLDK